MYVCEIKNGNQTFTLQGETEKLLSGKVTKGINSIDSFSFSMLPSNQCFDLINDFQTIVTVWNTRRNRYEFQGRVLYSSVAMDEDGLITKDVVCESYLGFLCDTQQEYVATRNWTVSELLQAIITQHNSQIEEYKQFTIGEVTVADNNDNVYIGLQRQNTWEAINDKLIKKLGGEIRVRVENGINYLDYLEKIGVTRATAIELSKNMKAITQENDPSGYVTRLIPLGAKLSENSEERLTIEAVNNGIPYIDDTNAISTFGIHVGYVEFDDVTVASTLKTKATNWLIENNKVKVKYSITALDLSLIGLDYDDFDVHNYHPIRNALLNINDTARVIKKTIDVCNEVQSTIEVGDKFKTLSEIEQDRVNDLSNRLDNVQQGLKDQIAGIDGTFFFIKFSAYADGHDMTDQPTDDTAYMGMLSTSNSADESDYTKYTWVPIGGKDGQDAILLMIESSSGNMFKNSDIATILSVSVIVGQHIITDSTKLKEIFGNNAKLTWQQKLFGETEFEDIPSDDERFSDNGFLFTINANDFDTKVVFNCFLEF